jgi:RNA polymerase sigma-70 factor, ECF subfamily
MSQARQGPGAGGEQERVRGGATSPASAVADAPTRRWLEQLRADGREREVALVELHALLLKATRFTLARRRAAWPLLGPSHVDELALEAADDALLSVLAHLDEYRGESRFTTWAWKFGILHASVALRRRAWMNRELPVENAGWESIGSEAAPEQRLEQQELLSALKQAVERALTPHQRTVFVALGLNGVPVDVLAERMGTTRGALYKTLHDARRKLRAHLDL